MYCCSVMHAVVVAFLYPYIYLLPLIAVVAFTSFSKRFCIFQCIQRDTGGLRFILFLCLPHELSKGGAFPIKGSPGPSASQKTVLL